jgi:hypothetical protein
MSNPRKHGAILPIVATITVIYASAYYAMVSPFVLHDDDIRSGPSRKRPPPRVIAVVPNYALSESRAWLVFAPMHWLDQRLRPHVWGDPHAFEEYKRNRFRPTDPDR